MPQPAANDRIAQDLIRVYEQAQAALIAELEQIAAEPNRFRQRRRLRELAALHDVTMAELRETSRVWWSTQVPVLHAAGAADFAGALGRGFTRQPVHTAAAESFARRTWGDVARRLEEIDGGTRREIRAMARSSTRSALLESRTAVQAGRDMAREAARQGLWPVQYHGGARHTMRDYADTVIRTTTATAYNDGAMVQARVEGIEHVQYADGPGCGVTAHNDGTEANGLIVPLDEVVALAHPRCVMPGQRVLPYGGVTEIRRAWFSGPRRQVTVELGSRRDHLSVGPHHPVLTRSGWKPGAQISEGDYLIHDQWADHARQRGLESDLDQMPLVEDLYASVLAVGTHALVPAASDDLHGDAVFCQGEVDVVWPAGGLLVVGDPASVEQAGEHHFVGADVGVDVADGAGSGDALGSRVGGPAGGVVGGGNQVLAFLGSGPRPPEPHSVARGAAKPVLAGRAPNRPLIPPDNGGDLRAGHAQHVEAPDALHAPGLAVHRAEADGEGAASLLGPDLAAALTGCVDLVGLEESAAFEGTELLDPLLSGELNPALSAGMGVEHRFVFSRVVTVTEAHYEGWVYDMSTGEGFFACEQLIARNCRRALLPAPFAQALPGADLSVGPERAEGPATIPGREPRQARTPRQPRAAAG